MGVLSEDLKKRPTDASEWVGSRRRLIGGVATAFGVAAGAEGIRRRLSTESSGATEAPATNAASPAIVATPDQDININAELIKVSENGPIEFREAPFLNQVAELQDWNVFLDAGEISRIIYSSPDVTFQAQIINKDGTVDPTYKITTNSLKSESERDEDDEIIAEAVDHIIPSDNPSQKSSLKLYPDPRDGSLFTLTVNGQKYSRRLTPPQYVYPSTTSEVVIASDQELGPQRMKLLDILTLAKPFIPEGQLYAFARRPLSSYGDETNEDPSSNPKDSLVLESQAFADQVSDIAGFVFEHIENIPEAREAWEVFMDRFDKVNIRLLDDYIQLRDPETNELSNPQPISLLDHMFPSQETRSRQAERANDPIDEKLVARRFVENIILDPEGWEKKFKQLNYEDPHVAQRSDQVIVAYTVSAIYNVLLAVDPEATRKFLPALQPWSDKPNETWIRLGNTHVFNTDAQTEFLTRENQPPPIYPTTSPLYTS